MSDSDNQLDLRDVLTSEMIDASGKLKVGYSTGFACAGAVYSIRVEDAFTVEYELIKGKQNIRIEQMLDAHIRALMEKVNREDVYFADSPSRRDDG